MDSWKSSLSLFPAGLKVCFACLVFLGSGWVLHSNINWWEHSLRLWECHRSSGASTSESRTQAHVLLVFVSHLLCCRTSRSRIFARLLSRLTFVCIWKGLGHSLYLCVFTYVLRFSCQTDLVDQNLLNFLPTGEHSDVYKALSTHPTDSESLNTDFLKSELLLLFFFSRYPTKILGNPKGNSFWG